MQSYYGATRLQSLRHYLSTWWLRGALKRGTPSLGAFGLISYADRGNTVKLPEHLVRLLVPPVL